MRMGGSTWTRPSRRGCGWDGAVRALLGRGYRPMGMMQEFKEFAVKGNVMDMGVGIVIGGAFTSIVSSFVADIVNPIIGLFTNGIDFSNLFISMSGEEYSSLAAAKEAGAATLNYGLFINAVISFMIVAFVLFLMIKGVNRLKQEAAAKQEAEEAAAPPEPSEEVVLLREIRDALKSERTAS